jgi:hypothetical protein
MASPVMENSGGGCKETSEQVCRRWNRTAGGEYQNQGVALGHSAIIGLGHKWWVFVKLMQAVWEHGNLLKQMRWEIKGMCDYPGIGLLEPFWKVAEKIILAQLAPIKFHDGLHGGFPGRGTWTATIETFL